MIERTFDYRKVKRIASWQPIITSNVIYLLDDDQDLWAFHEHLDGLMIHAELSINRRGKDAVNSAHRAFQWILNNTSTRKIYAVIPKIRKAACYMAAWSGMNFMYEDDRNRHYEVNLYGIH